MLYNDEMGEIIGAGIAQADAILLGRRTYLEFAALWPGMGSDVPMADFMNNTPKYIVSSTLHILEWANSTLLALMVHPIVLGSGLRLFEEMTGRISLTLVDSRTLSTGVVSVTYQPARAADEATPPGLMPHAR